MVWRLHDGDTSTTGHNFFTRDPVGSFSLNTINERYLITGISLKAYRMDSLENKLDRLTPASDGKLTILWIFYSSSPAAHLR